MTAFAELYQRLEEAAKPEHLGLGLRPRLGRAYEAVVAKPYDPWEVTLAVEDLLEYLTTPAGRTNANCVAVDHFFCLRDGWEGHWEDEPTGLADVLGDMGGALHDTISAPEIAENFDSTPELLLEALRAFKGSHFSRTRTSGVKRIASALCVANPYALRSNPRLLLTGAWARRSRARYVSAVGLRGCAARPGSRSAGR